MNSSLKKFLEELQKFLPGFNIKFKNESILMKIIGKILFFTPGFMTDFVTTIGDTVYFPSREKLEHRGLAASVTLAHEFVHAMDAKKMSSFLFGFLYLIPQILAPFMLFFCLLYWWLGLLLFVIFLTPIPAFFRTHYEIRGYTMSLFMFDQLKKKQNLKEDDRRHYLQELIKHYNTNFTGSNYYFMWPFGVEKKLQKAANRIVSGSILTDNKIYEDVLRAAKNSGIL